MARFTLPPHLEKRIVQDTRPANRAPPPGPSPAPAPDVPAKPKKTRNTSPTNSLTTAIIEWLQLQRCKAWRQNNAPVYDPARGCFRKGSTVEGISDVMGYHRPTGRVLAVEVKVGRDTLSDEQREFLAEVRAAGGFACEGRALEQVQREFDQWKQSLNQFNQAA
ncbi:VRR-NUC domain-containing protein [Hymenobacter sp. 102]|uniref:VRR-NUC domain-containing protein n=1 Tax=Hymenobacter sp. 102 TaxID=3403152 RepID=UPI003CED1CA7